MNREKTKRLTTCALFAAFIFAVTAITGALALTGGGGYIHIGDAVIYLAALALPLPYAVGAAAVGAAFADLTLGSAIYIIPTIIVKSLVVLTAKGLMRTTSKPVLQDALICLSGIVTVAGYYVAEVVLQLFSGSAFGAAVKAAAVNSILSNTLQALASAAVFIFAAGAYRRIVDKKELKSGQSENNGDDSGSEEK